MRNTWLPAILALTLFAACRDKNKATAGSVDANDTLKYTYHEIKQRADDCGNKADNDDCSIADVYYPVFAEQPALNDTITKKLLRLFNNDPDKDLETLAKNFIAGYDRYKKLRKHKPASAFDLELNAQLVHQQPGLVILQIDGSSFAGNIHPIAQTQYINWDTGANSQVTLSDLFIPNFKDTLNKVAEKIFRKEEGLKDTASLKKGYFFKDAKFYLNNNFMITPGGLRFLYNQYEIKPFSAGTTELIIPYTQIKTLLKPNTVITQYIK